MADEESECATNISETLKIEDKQCTETNYEANEKEMKPPEPVKKPEKVSKPKEKEPDLAYKVPSWSGIPTEPYSCEILKNGCIISTIDLSKKPYYVVGRLQSCDITMEHPSVSRHHAILQYKVSDGNAQNGGFYLYDMGSTHGTFVNKAQIKAKTYYRLKVGFVIKFAGSSRLFIFQGPQDENEDEVEDTVGMKTTVDKELTSVKKGDVMTAEDFESWKQERNKKIEEEGIDWGMGEDAEPEEQTNPAESENTEESELILKDPKKTLRGYFEREGLELEYEVEEKGPGHAKSFHARVKLPIENAAGDSLYAEAVVQGKKKEAVLAVALEACRILDNHGLLRQSAHESRKHREKNYEENDFYDSDEDTFLDRTGSVEKKRINRMKKAGKTGNIVETHKSLLLKLETNQEQIKQLEERLAQDEQDKKSVGETEDSLDVFMSDVGSVMDKSTRMKIKRQIFDLKKEEKRLEKLVAIAAPSEAILQLQREVVNKELEDRLSSPTEAVQISTPSTSECDTPQDIQLQTNEDASRNVKPDEFKMPVLPPFKPPPSPEMSTKTAPIPKLDNSEEIQETTRKKRPTEEAQDGLQKPAKKKKKMYSAPSQWEALNDPSISEWTPPTGQTGDGKTSLNEKFGY